MTARVRNRDRIELIQLFVSEFSAMDNEALGTLSEFLLSTGILLLIYQGEVNGEIGVIVVGFMVSIDLVRAAEAWRNARNELEREETGAE